MPVNLANTGGWVVDTIDANPLQGAAAVLVDEDLEVVSSSAVRPAGRSIAIPGTSQPGDRPGIWTWQNGCRRS